MGDLIGGRYELGERLGSGGMADVYAAYDRTLERPVALKLLRESLSSDPTFVARFTREARSAASITHPRVVQVLDAGSVDGRHYIAMELVPGGTLKQVIQRQGPFPERRALRIAREIADGVAVAHARGIIHRDLKAQNVLIDASGYPKVADFGIARTTDETSLTQTAALLGSVHYLAPEQAAGGPIDERADVYSLGVVLYEMLTGILPFRADTPLEIANLHLHAEPVPARRIRTGLRAETDALVARAMAKRPAKRFRSAAELRDAIDSLLGERPVPVVAPQAAPAARAAIRPRPLLTAVASILLLLVGGVVLASKDPATIGTRRAAPTSPVVAVTSIPQPTTAAPSTAAPTTPPTPEPTDVPAPTAAPVVTAPPPAVLAVRAGDPAAAVVSFYQLVTDGRYGDAAGLWSARMRSSYPPASNIDQRFADTRWIAADRAVTTFEGADAATVSVYVTEVTSSGTRHWAGTWTIVRSGSTWLMDAPQLGPA
jgi:eukaryotic-like serine/threonine-protein kinase